MRIPPRAVTTEIAPAPGSCCRLLGVARKFRDSAERADTPRGFGVGHLPGD